jgi:hypothetical protein
MKKFGAPFPASTWQLIHEYTLARFALQKADDPLTLCK